MNDPEIAACESEAARREHEYLINEKEAILAELVELATAGTVNVPRLDMTGMRCQEASQFSFQRYIACGQPATKLVLSERGRRLYPMCEPCADHNVRNRGAKLAAVHEAMDV